MKCIQILLFLGIALNVSSQEVSFGVCGTENLEEIKQEMLRNREEFKNFKYQRGAINYVPIKITVANPNDGSGVLPIYNILRMMCILNTVYKDIEIQFYIKEIKQLNSTTVAENPKSSGAILQMQSNKDRSAVNIYLVNNIPDVNGSAGSTLGAWFGPAGSTNDFIIVLKSTITDVRVVAHEIGHYFSLPHTFHGWDFTPWDPAIHGNPVTLFAPDGITINEFADSSNCGPKNVGDGFCDTPADYNFLSSQGCTYTFNAKDPNGKLLKPQTNNYMNYFFGCSNYVFTNQQKDAVLASWNSANRREIRGTSPPVPTIITQAAKLLSPANASPTTSADSVFLDWEDVPGATSYLVQYDNVPSFELFVQNFIVKESKLKLTNLVLNRTYHWRVIPYNEYSTCFLDATKFTFKAGAQTAVKDLPQVKSLALFPNPIRTNQQINLSLDCYAAFNGLISIYDLSGKLIIDLPSERFNSGLNNKTLNISALDPGVYSFVLKGKEGIASRKLVVY